MPAASASALPITNPATSRTPASFKISRITPSRVAPSAMRIPISPRLRATM
ncbi:MAG TPA: hypothetical protein VGG97_28160 [Bryobacteraceae bacterium]